MINNRYSSNIKIFINDIDVTEGMTSTEIYMDITNPFWSAKIIFLDSVNLIDTIPIQKNADVKISLTTRNYLLEETKDFNFKLYKIGDKYQQNQKVVGYTLYVVSEPLLSSLTKNISRPLKGEPISLLVGMFNGLFPKFTCSGDTSNGNINIIASAWKPFNVFGNLLKYAHKNNKADYLLHQNTDKTFVVRTISDMYNDLTDVKFKYVPSGLTGNTYPYIITKYEVEHFDSAMNLSSGYYGSNVYKYDLMDKTFSNKLSSNKDDKENLSDGIEFSDDINATINFQMVHSNITPDSQLETVDTWLPTRYSALFGLEQEKLLIQTQCNVEYVYLIGKAVLAEIPKQDYTSKEQLDEKRSGKYLVSGISFIINKQMAVTNMELVKRKFSD